MKFLVLFGLAFTSANAMAVINSFTLKADMTSEYKDPAHSDYASIEVYKDMTNGRKNEIRFCNISIDTQDFRTVAKGSTFEVISEKYSQERIAPNKMWRHVEIKATNRNLKLNLRLQCQGNRENPYPSVFTNAELEKTFEKEFSIGTK